MKNLLLGLTLLGSLSTFASSNKCDVFVRAAPVGFGGNLEHSEIKHEVRNLLVDELHSKGFNIVENSKEASIVFNAPVSGCAQGLGSGYSRCIRAYAMLDYKFVSNDKDTQTKKLRGSSVWSKDVDGVKVVARRAFSGSDSSLFGNTSQRDAVKDAVSKIKECK